VTKVCEKETEHNQAIELDFRLIDTSGEIYALEEYLQTLEEHLENLKSTEGSLIESRIKVEGLSSDDPEWHEILSQYTDRMDFILPRFFRGPFLVALYAVYESGVIEIARLMQKKLAQQISINDLKGAFLDRAKKYYKHILGFPLHTEDEAWQRIQMLSTLRNAIAHSNGRIDLLKNEPKEKVLAWEQQNLGVTVCYGYIVFDAELVATIFEAVKRSLEGLIERYKNWDDSKCASEERI